MTAPFAALTAGAERPKGLARVRLMHLVPAPREATWPVTANAVLGLGGDDAAWASGFFERGRSRSAGEALERPLTAAGEAS